MLATLALAAAPRSIAVVLSGGGQDGATGATAIHDLGGVVVVVEPATSGSAHMPRAASIAATLEQLVALVVSSEWTGVDVAYPIR